MRALQFDAPRKARVVEVADPTPGAHDVVIRVAACGICGTDVHIFHGDYLGEYPIVPGHEFAGRVEAVGNAVARVRVGDLAAIEPNLSCGRCEACLSNRQNFCDAWRGIGVTLPGGMAELAAAPEEAVFPVAGVSAETAAFTEPLSCVLHGVERAAVDVSDRVLLIGAGPIGMLLLRTLRARGAARIDVAERSATRLARAAASGADRAETDLGALRPDTYDLVVDATGSPAVLERTLDYARPGGRVLWFGVPPQDARVSIPAFTVFRKGLSVIGSYTSLRNSHQAVRLLESGIVPVEDLVSHRVPLADVEAGIGLLTTGADDVMKVMVIPG